MTRTTAPHIRDVRPADFARVHALNDAAQPHVNGVPPETIARFAAEAAYFRVAEDDGRVAGFLIAMTPGNAYDCVNFEWFRARYDSFVYVDRIVVAEESRGRGVGRLLYADVTAFAAPLAPRLTCEVNLRPRNERSLRFHAALGFEPVGEQDTEGGAKTVRLMVKELRGRSARRPPPPAR